MAARGAGFEVLASGVWVGGACAPGADHSACDDDDELVSTASCHSYPDCFKARSALGALSASMGRAGRLEWGLSPQL